MSSFIVSPSSHYPDPRASSTGASHNKSNEEDMCVPMSQLLPVPPAGLSRRDTLQVLDPHGTAQEQG